MEIAIRHGIETIDVRALHDRMGRVFHQPVRVHSFTNKRFTVNFRVPLGQLCRIVPDAIDLDEIPGTGFGILSMCACDFWVSRFGWLPLPPIRNNDMLSFQKIDYPPWDMYFCHEHRYDFALIDYLRENLGLDLELDCVLFMQNTRQTWGTSWLYRN
jgi:hypothetical protein